MPREQYRETLRELRHRKVNFRRAAVLALQANGDSRAVPALVDSLSDPDSIVRKRAADAMIALGNVHDGITIPALVESLAGEPDDDVYAAKFRAIAHYSGSKVTWAALYAVWEAMKPEEKERLLAELITIGSTNRAAFETMRPILRDALQFGTDKTRVLAIAALGAHPNAFDRDLLKPYVTHSDVNTRLFALQEICRFRDQEAADTVKAALKDKNPLIRRQAVDSITAWKDPGDFMPLAMMCRDAHPLVRRGAAKGLGIFKDPDAQPWLRELLIDGDAGVRLEAAHSLAILDQHAGFDILVWNMAENSDREERRLAAHGLYVLNTRHAASHFRRALMDRDLNVRETAKKALRRLGYH